MSDDTPAAPQAPAKAPRANMSAPLLRLLRDIGPYALALTIFVITANYALNATAAHYADELFTLALVLIRTGPKPPSQTGGQP